MGKKEESVDLNALNAEEWERLKASDGLIVVDVSLLRREWPGLTDPLARYTPSGQDPAV